MMPGLEKIISLFLKARFWLGKKRFGFGEWWTSGVAWGLQIHA